MDLLGMGHWNNRKKPPQMVWSVPKNEVRKVAEDGAVNKQEGDDPETVVGLAV